MGIGLVRTLLAISVVVAHSSLICGYNIANGTTAVQSFYIISGFYMALILNEKYVGSHSLWLFYSNRFLKIYPIYWVTLCLTVIASAYSLVRYGEAGSLYLQPWVEHDKALSVWQILYLVGANVLIFGQDLTLFLKFNFANGFFSPTANFYQTSPTVTEFLFIPQAWTLAVEFSFYCLAPLIVRRSRAFVLSLLCVSVLARVALLLKGLFHDPWSYRFFPLELALFCGGCASYSMYQTARRKRLFPWLPRAVTMLLIGLLLGFNYFPTLLVVRRWCFYVALVFALPYMFELSKRSVFDRFVGDLSYPIYIVHHLICSLLSFYTGVTGSLYGCLAVVGSIGIAALLQVGFQRPIENFREQRTAVLSKMSASGASPLRTIESAG